MIDPVASPAVRSIHRNHTPALGSVADHPIEVEFP
jgi:hypothetical protein